MKRALIAMSGGVDSSVAAQQLVEQGYDCIGCTMKLYHNEDVGLKKNNTCCSLEDVEDARSVAWKLGMPYYVFNYTESFREKVMRKFADSYEAGITPNPCIDCNRYMKFDKLLERAKILDCDYIVTGHYARIVQENGKYILKKAVDASKDQSYVLYSLTQDQLAHILFPLGDLRKSEVRHIAAVHGLVNADKPDSQDICFVPDGNYVDFLERYTGRKYPEGHFIAVDGSVLGVHKGAVRYTIGQRKGLGLSLSKPMYVTHIDIASNTVTLGEEKDLYRKETTAADFNWISGEIPQGPIRCKVKLRYRHEEQWAMVTPLAKEQVRIVFDEGQRAITPGQAAVLYEGDVVLGGGIIV